MESSTRVQIMNEVVSEMQIASKSKELEQWRETFSYSNAALNFITN